MEPALTQQESKKLDQKYEKEYKYYKDTRKANEIQLTNRLARSLSQNNCLSVTNKSSSNSRKTIKKQDILYVCLNGVPPFEEQFKHLELPGECIQFRFICFEKGKTEEQLMNMPTQFQEQAKILHQRINQISKVKPIIFIYHSFGTYTLAAYVNQFNTERILGLIDTGGAPIRFYPVVTKYIKSLEKFTLQTIKQNIDTVFNNHNKGNKQHGLAPYNNKYQVLGVFRSMKKGVGLKQAFQILRNLPKVLKCFIYGRKDILFPEDFLNQKVVYYSYKNKFQESYQQKCKKAFERCFGERVESVQSRFIFSFEDGYHSMHMQRKFKDWIAKIVKYYLQFIEEVHAEEQSKL